MTTLNTFHGMDRPVRIKVNITTGARYFRLDISKIRTPGVNYMQISELIFLYNGVIVPSSGAVVTDSQSKYDGEGSPLVFDNNLWTKWLAYSVPVSLFIAFSSSIKMNQYQFVTGNDTPGRDPVSWILYSSPDKITYTVTKATKTKASKAT